MLDFIVLFGGALFLVAIGFTLGWIYRADVLRGLTRERDYLKTRLAKELAKL